MKSKKKSNTRQKCYYMPCDDELKVYEKKYDEDNKDIMYVRIL